MRADELQSTVKTNKIKKSKTMIADELKTTVKQIKPKSKTKDTKCRINRSVK